MITIHCALSTVVCTVNCALCTVHCPHHSVKYEVWEGGWRMAAQLWLPRSAQWHCSVTDVHWSAVQSWSENFSTVLATLYRADFNTEQCTVYIVQCTHQCSVILGCTGLCIIKLTLPVHKRHSGSAQKCSAVHFTCTILYNELYGPHDCTALYTALYSAVHCTATPLHSALSITLLINQRDKLDSSNWGLVRGLPATGCLQLPESHETTCRTIFRCISTFNWSHH